MHLLLNDQELEIPEASQAMLFSLLQQKGAEQLEKLGAEMRIMAQIGAREILRKLEKQARAKHGVEPSLVFRPDKGEDPCIRMLKIGEAAVREAVTHVTIRITTDGNTLTGITFTEEHKDQAERPMALDGDQRMREDNGDDLPGRSIPDLIPADASLHS